MAAIGSIRKHTGLLIGIIGIAMLLFLLGGLIESSTTFFGGSPNVVGKINGHTVTYQDFELKVAKLEQNSGADLNEKQRDGLRTQVWDELVKSQILDIEYAALGLSVCDEELLNIIKNDNNNPVLKQYFTNPQTGQLSPDFSSPDGTLNGVAVISYLKQIYGGGEETQEALTFWDNFQSTYIRKPALDEKYADLIGKGIYITDVELENTLRNEKSTLSFDYVYAPFKSISDTLIEVTPTDLHSYYDDHKNETQFDQKELTSSFTYVSFEVLPSPEDKSDLESELIDIKSAFSDTHSDTLFVNENGDTPMNIRWVTPGELPLIEDQAITQGDVGDVDGPFLRQDRFELIKILDKQLRPDSAMASHILIQSANGNIATAKTTIDSLKNAIENGGDFASLAAQYSNDPGSASKGGDLGWFVEGQMVPAFNDACFEGELNDLVVVNSQFGVHLIRITGLTEPKPKTLVAIVDNVVEPSQASYEKAYNTASIFAITNNTPEKFNEASLALNPVDASNIRPLDPTIMGIPDTRAVVRWVFDASVGDVSEVFEAENIFIVGLVTDVRQIGVLPFELVEDQIRDLVLIEKKSEILIAKMKGETLKDIASATNGTIQPANNVTFNSYSIQGMGNEQSILGAAFAVDLGDVSPVIKGEQGVCVFKVNKREIPEKLEIVAGTREGKMAASARRASFEPFNALKNNADIVDNRYTFF